MTRQAEVKVAACPAHHVATLRARLARLNVGAAEVTAGEIVGAPVLPSAQGKRVPARANRPARSEGWRCGRHIRLIRLALMYPLDVHRAGPPVQWQPIGASGHGVLADHLQEVAGFLLVQQPLRCEWHDHNSDRLQDARLATAQRDARLRAGRH